MTSRCVAPKQSASDQLTFPSPGIFIRLQQGWFYATADMVLMYRARHMLHGRSSSSQPTSPGWIRRLVGTGW